MGVTSGPLVTRTVLRRTIGLLDQGLRCENGVSRNGPVLHSEFNVSRPVFTYLLWTYYKTTWRNKRTI